MINLKDINKNFILTEEELEKIRLIQRYVYTEFSLIRMTETMINKSIIDASFFYEKF